MNTGGKKTYEPEIVDRFLAKIDKTDMCWIWTACTSEGYGRFGVGGKHQYAYAHRFAYELWVGPIPERHELHHNCANRACVNPDHLVPVTREDHPDSGPAIERLRTNCNQGHPLDGVFVRSSTGRQIRYCKTCNRENQKRRRNAA